MTATAVLVAGGSAGALAATAKDADATTPPVVVAAGAGDVRDTSATIGIALGPSDDQVRVHAEYGPTDAYGSKTPESRIPAHTDVIAVYRDLKRLDPSTEYHFRFVARGTGGETVGPDQTFSTAAPGEIKAADPAQGLFVYVAETSGQVRVRRAGRHRFTRLDGSDGLRLGSVVDARRGRVAVTTALPDGARQTATFHGGKFAVRQSGGDGRTEIHLRGGSTRACAKATAARKRRRKHRIRRLWSSDTSGLYSTYGLNSVATVLGTRWLTVDRCDGTLTRVTRGAVRIRDRHTGRTVLVRAGHSHLARSR